MRHSIIVNTSSWEDFIIVMNQIMQLKSKSDIPLASSRIMTKN